MSTEDPQPETTERPQSAFGRRHAVIDKDGKQLRGFTTESFHETHWTPERKEEQRQKMLALHAAGKAGGQHGFHRRRAKKAQEILAERFQEEADKIWQRLEAMLDQPKDKRLQLEAIRELAKFEEWSTKNAREDEKELRKLSGAQLDTRLLEMMGEALGIDFSAFKGDFEPIIEGQLVGEQPQLEESCEGCDEERDRVADLLRQSGIEDDELVAVTAGRARCEGHRAD